jgi:hypothetical protein
VNRLYTAAGWLLRFWIVAGWLLIVPLFVYLRGAALLRAIGA